MSLADAEAGILQNLKQQARIATHLIPRIDAYGSRKLPLVLKIAQAASAAEFALIEPALTNCSCRICLASSFSCGKLTNISKQHTSVMQVGEYVLC